MYSDADASRPSGEDVCCTLDAQISTLDDILSSRVPAVMNAASPPVRPPTSPALMSPMGRSRPNPQQRRSPLVFSQPDQVSHCLTRGPDNRSQNLQGETAPQFDPNIAFLKASTAPPQVHVVDDQMPRSRREYAVRAERRVDRCCGRRADIFGVRLFRLVYMYI